MGPRGGHDAGDRCTGISHSFNVRRHPPTHLLLQEVDCFPLLQQQMSSLGYLSVFAARTGDRTDGCATFWQVAGGKVGRGGRNCFLSPLHLIAMDPVFTGEHWITPRA